MYGNCKYAVKLLLPIDIPSEDGKKLKVKENKFKWMRTIAFNSTVDLKQGCNLSPLLANIFLSDLHLVLEYKHVDAPKLNRNEINSITWADGLLILSQSHLGLQRCILALEEYARSWGLVVSLKKARCVIFSKGKTKYETLTPLIYNHRIIPYERFYKYLGVEITDNCEFRLAKEERVLKARKAVFTIRQALTTSGNVSVNLAMKLFDSKIEPVLTYGSIIWGIESSNNLIIIDGLKEANDKTTKDLVNRLILGTITYQGEIPPIGFEKRLGRKTNIGNRKILVKFVHYQDKEKILCNPVVEPSISIKANFFPSACKDIQMINDKYIKYAINLPKRCSNLISRAEVGKYPIQFKVWSQMIKYFIRVAQGTRNIIVNDAFACAIAQNTRWIQTAMRLLKVNGFYDAFLYPHDINKDSFKKTFMKRCQDNYLQELRFSEGTKINEYLNLQENENYQYQSYLEKIRIVEHRKTVTKLRAGITCLSVEKGRHQNLLREKRVCPVCENGIEDLKHSS